MPGLNLTRTEARERAELLTVRSYDITLDLSRGERVFGSTTVVSFDAEQGASTFVDAVTDTVHRVELNGVELDPAEVSDGVRIQLPVLAATNTLVVEADMPYMNTGEGLHRFVDPVDGEVYLYTQFEVPDSRRVFAVFEQPDLKSRFRFSVTAPSHWDVISVMPTPAPVQAESDAATGAYSTWYFEPTPVMSSYVTAVIAGPYRSVRSELTGSDGRTVPLGVFTRKSLIQYLDAENVFDLTRKGFAFYEEQFGTPYPFEKYDQLFVPEFNAGAMENAGAVTFVETYVFRSRVPDATVERRAITILHELAHMWFGDLVTMRWWNDLWLNESFAEFMSTLAAAEATEFEQAWTTFAILEKGWAYRQDQLPSTHPIVAEIEDLEDVQVNFDGITYAKGASVLKQLVAWVGQEAFMAGVRQYFAKHAWKNTELPDLLDELEAASGRDLKQWSALWLETAGVNTLRPEFTTDDAGVLTSFAILQSAIDAFPTIRPHRLAVGFYDLDETGTLVRTHRLELDVDGERTDMPDLVGRKQPALVLLNDDDLAYAKIRLDPASLRTSVQHVKDFADSLPRTLVLASAWDAARDGETPARDYVELVLRNVGAESDSSVVLVLLRQLATALSSYVHPDRREALGSTAADTLLELVLAADAGSDAQLQFVRAFSAHAATGNQLDAVEGMLSGERVPEGLAVDQDLRWELLTSLVAGGRAGTTEIDAELGADTTATGHLAAASARAAIPTSEAKEAAWTALVESADLPNSTQRAMIGGFTRVHDRTLLAPFVERYFGAVRDVWATRTSEIAQQIVVGLYPSLLTGQETLERTDAFLAELGEDSPSLRRLVLESRDGVERALRAQVADR
ncbi:aminopeptidase N [Arthrobacter sp. RIT-PI-e]|uniref:aminopeptidase N n=1 Tax=Arthrobacter sp. RIT-PI-e TaxID=1681197 RepID=UPI0006766D55|nr:aminopeptidase N [Arthrobacter sp. RIT-PI-e]KNC19126.1 aminopeptidase N [Arthrobacter sp. RIT-PI-e]